MLHRGFVNVSRALSIVGAALLLFLAFIIYAFRCFDSCPPESERLNELASFLGVLLPAVGAIAAVVLARRSPRLAGVILVAGAVLSGVALTLREFTTPTFAAPLALLFAGALLLVPH